MAQPPKPFEDAIRAKEAAVPSREIRVAATPRRTKKDMPKPSQDAELRDYQLGDCLGKGAFGSVYRALNMSNGETVAVKQIRLADLPKSELRVITLEIDLLKNLDHPNIVKYHGFVKSAEALNIILEYCENGSLHSISKNFGKFPENLVAIYMSQVLQGLLYLHEQGVIHRDIKGANILTTKKGDVKLADFGVATRTTTLHESSVVGTPYWMAPEVIELAGATTASDIWSLGCTVIELLDGKPPYHKMQPMHALFRIVNDDHPPLPEGASPIVRDFLMQCFQKDPNLRVSARKLLKHPWIMGARKAGPEAPKKTVDHQEAVKSVQQWNEALKSPNSSLRRLPGPNPLSPIPANRRDRPTSAASNQRSIPVLHQHKNSTENVRGGDGASDDNWDADFASDIDPSALQLPHLKPRDHFGGLLSAEKLKNFASIQTVAEEGRWDDDFEGEPTVKSPMEIVQQDPLKTVRPYFPARANTSDIKAMPPTRSPRRRSSQTVPPRKVFTRPVLKSKQGPGEQPKVARSTLLYQEDPVEDYSDLLVGNDDAFENKILLSKGQKKPSPSPQLFQASDLENLKSSQRTPAGGSVRKVQQRRHPSLRRSQSSVEIQRYAENENDEDFSDIFSRSGATAQKEASDGGSDSGTLMLNSKLSNNSWLGDEEDEDDPFAQLEEGFDETDLAANVARDKYARLCTQIETLVGSLKMNKADDSLADVSEQLLEILLENPDTKGVVISAHGMLPILEILESCRRRDIILALLRIVNLITFEDVETQENLCFVGGIPIITQFASNKYSSEIRLEAAAFVRQICQTSTLTLQMFVSAGGLKVLVEFLEEDYEDERDLVLIGVNGVWSVFELQGPTPKNDFCRILSRNSVLDPLSLVLSRVLDEKGMHQKNELAMLCEGRIANIFLLFSQAENHVKELVAERTVLHRVLKELKRMSVDHQVTMLKFIKNLSMLTTTLDALQNSNAIDVLTELLRTSMKNIQFREMSNQILNTIYNLCRLNKSRQEDAALNDIIPILMRIYKTDRPLKEFVLPIICDMAHSGKVGRRELWRNKGLQFYTSLLEDPYWQVTALDSIFIWLQEETARVEEQLLEGSFTCCILRCFTTAKANSFENLLEPLQKLLRLSPAIALSLAQPELFARILQKLSSNKPLTRLNLLRIVQSICDASEEQGALISVHGLYDTIQRLSEHDSAILVRDMASKLARSCEGHELLARSGGKRKATRRMSTSSAASSAYSASQPPTPTSSRSRPPIYRLESGNRNRPSMTGPVAFRPLSREYIRGDTSSAAHATSSPGMSIVSSSAVVRSRLPRTSTTKAGRQSLLQAMPRKEDSAGSVTAPGILPEMMVPNSRRRRQTSGGESRWS